ncbi:MAG: sigma-70 family RNA polymerase sigma factor [bacterium]
MPVKAKTNIWEEPFGFRIELVRCQQKGGITEGFIDKLKDLVRAKRPRSESPGLYGLESETWDESAIHELALNFLTEHLLSKNGPKLPYIKESADQGVPVDGYVIEVFKQFLAEIKRRKVPHRWNMRKRILQVLKEMESQGKLVPCQKFSGSWRSSANSYEERVEMEHLRSIANLLPNVEKKIYVEQERMHPVLDNRELSRLVDGVFELVSGCVSEEELVEFLLEQLQVSDPSFQYLEDLLTERSEHEFAQNQAMSPEVRQRLKRAIEGLCPRQKKIFNMRFLQEMSIPEICSVMGLGKTVVYQEVAKIERRLKGF